MPASFACARRARVDIFKCAISGLAVRILPLETCVASSTVRAGSATDMDAPLLHSIENITYPAQYQALRRFYAGPAAGFKVYLDDACALPSDWKSTWDHPRQWGLTGNKNWATKYGAQGFIPHMLSLSPFVTTDWRQASASIAVVFARQFAGASAHPNPNPNPNLGRAGA